MIGIKDNDNNRVLLRALGLREITCGLGILTRPAPRGHPAGWLWARVAGDAMDLALLGRALASNNVERNRLAAATAAVAGITGLDLIGGRQLGRDRQAAGKRATSARLVDVKKTITINRPPEELYRFWHDFQNLPRFMRHLESVQVAGGGGRRSHWMAKAPAGKKVEWDAEIVDDRPNELIAWRSLEGADVDNSGLVRFTPAPGGRGTQVHVELQYNPPGGRAGAKIAKIFGEEPAQQVEDDLRAFKQVVETGEVVLSEGTLGGAGTHIIQRPAQPPAEGAWA
jgi:uncharacterized membrane protein